MPLETYETPELEDPRPCVIFTGAGDRAFCAGVDLKERRGMSDADWNRQHPELVLLVRLALGDAGHLGRVQSVQLVPVGALLAWP